MSAKVSCTVLKTSTSGDRRAEFNHESDQSLLNFHIEHIVPKKHHGTDDPDNLAWACIFCNLYKGPNLASFDPEIGELTRLFNPRRDRWEEHFRIEGALIVGLTPVGRTTCWLL